MPGNPKIQIDIVADGSDAKKELEKTSGAFEKFGKGLDKASGFAAGGLVAMAGFGAAAVDMAADAEVAATSVDRAFGASATAVHEFAKSAAEDVGVSTAQYETLAATFGTAMQGMGLSAEESATKTDQMLTAAGDLALAAGVDVPTAAGAMGAALRGETDAISEFGVKIDESTVLAGLAAKGITDPATGLAPAIGSAQYQQELLNQVMELSGTTYQGYRDETDTTTEATDAMKAKFEDATTQLGEALLPILGDVATALSDAADWVVANKDQIIKWIPVVAGAAGAVWLLNFAMAANPAVLLFLAILALVGVFYIFRDEIGKVAAAADFVMDTLDNFIPGLGPVRTAFKFFTGDVQTLYNWFMSLIGAIDAVADAWDRFTTKKIGGTAVIAQPPPPSLFAVPGGGMVSARSLTTGAAPVAAAGTSITIQAGVGDPDAIARAVQRVLGGRTRRVGGIEL